MSWVIILLCALAIIVLLLSFLDDLLRGSRAGRPSDTLAVSADGQSLITVRKVGDTTRVDIRRGGAPPSEWGPRDEGVPLGPVPVEVTALTEPDLYREYLSAKTTATRKYEIISYIYGIGLTLPYIPGLHEQYLKEQEQQEQAAARKRTAKPKQTLHIDRSVSDIPMDDIDDAPDVRTPEDI